jgi:hypothetical protein
MGGVCSKHERDKKFIQNFGRKSEVKTWAQMEG